MKIRMGTAWGQLPFNCITAHYCGVLLMIFGAVLRVKKILDESKHCD